VLASGSLLVSGLVLGVASSASATTTDTLVVTNSAQLQTSVASGAALSPQPSLQVALSGGGADTSISSGTATAAITSGTGGTLTGATSATFASGVASFSALAISGVAGRNYTITFSYTMPSSTDVISATASFTVTVGAATQLAITTQPASGEISGVALSGSPAVQVGSSGR